MYLLNLLESKLTFLFMVVILFVIPAIIAWIVFTQKKSGTSSGPDRPESDQ